MTSNVCFQPISVKCKENDLDRKYWLLGGPAENASLPTISQIMKLMILFHLQTLGAGHHIPSFLNFCIIKFWKIFTVFLNVQFFVCVTFFFTGKRSECKNYECDSLDNSIPYKMMFQPPRSKTVAEDAFLVAKVEFFKGGGEHIITWQY